MSLIYLLFLLSIAIGVLAFVKKAHRKSFLGRVFLVAAWIAFLSILQEFLSLHFGAVQAYSSWHFFRIFLILFLGILVLWHLFLEYSSILTLGLVLSLLGIFLLDHQAPVVFQSQLQTADLVHLAFSMIMVSFLSLVPILDGFLLLSTHLIKTGKFQLAYRFLGESLMEHAAIREVFLILGLALLMLTISSGVFVSSSQPLAKWLGSIIASLFFVLSLVSHSWKQPLKFCFSSLAATSLWLGYILSS